MEAETAIIVIAWICYTQPQDSSVLDQSQERSLLSCHIRSLGLAFSFSTWLFFKALVVRITISRHDICIMVIMKDSRTHSTLAICL